jgi:RNA polymerase sigma-70 factor (ECF subfamily)
MPGESLRTDDYIEAIVEKYSSMVYKIAFSQTKCKSDADDVFQDVFLRYIKSKSDFESEEHEKAWFIRVTINCSRKIWSSAWHKRTVALDESMHFENQEMNEIYQVVMDLPVKFRTVIHLFYYEDMSIAQISKTLQMKESTIRTRLTRARAFLRDKMKEDDDDV